MTRMHSVLPADEGTASFVHGSRCPAGSAPLQTQKNPRRYLRSAGYPTPRVLRQPPNIMADTSPSQSNRSITRISWAVNDSQGVAFH